MRPFLACGMCVDRSLFGLFPFFFYWIILFVSWSLVVGPVLALMAKLKKDRLPPLPHQYLLLGLGLWIPTCPLTMGAVAVPFCIAASIALFKMGHSYWRNRRLPAEPSRLHQTARSLQRMYITICLILIPVAYIRVWWQSH